MPRFFKCITVSDIVAAVGILAITALGLSLLSRALTWGVWAFSDSAEYIVSARMLVAGRGLGIPSPDGGFMPLSLHPPLYPLVISVFFLLNIDPLDALPGLNLVLFAATILVSGGLVYYLTRDALMAISASALVALPPTMLSNFDGAMTEPLYIPLSLLAILLLVAYWQKNNRAALVAAGIVTALAGLVRYNGLTILAVGLLVILLSGQPFRRRLQDAALFIAVGFGPLLVWFIHLYLQSGLVAARSFSSSGNLADKFPLFRKNFMETLVLWVPYIVKAQTWFQKALVTYSLVGLSILVGCLAWWRGFRKGARRTPEVENGLKLMAVGFFSVVAYLAFLAISFLFSSITPDINDRTMAPLLPVAMLFLSAVLFVTPRVFGLRRVFQIMPLIVVLVAGQFYYRQTSSLTSHRDQQSRGYAAPRWRNSELVQAVRNLPADQLLISNVPIPVLLYTDRFPYSIQELDLAQVQTDPAPYGEGDDPAQEVFRQDGAALVIFQPELTNQMVSIYGVKGPDRVATLLAGLTLTDQTQDGYIFIHSK